MHPLWKKVLGSGIWTKVSSIQALRSPARTFSHGKGMRSLQIQIKRLSLDFFMLSLGILSAGFGLKGFSFQTTLLMAVQLEFPSLFQK